MTDGATEVAAASPLARRGRLVLIAVLALAAPVGAQQASPPPPVFDTRIGVVLVDVVVTDKRHRPVHDLRASDFRVFQDGARQEIVSFAAFRPVPAAAPETGSGASGSAPIHSVQASTVVLIDEAHLSPLDAGRAAPALSQVLGGLTERQGFVLVLAPWSNIAYGGRLPGDAAMMAEAARAVRGRRFPMISTFPMTDSEAVDIEGGDTLTEGRVLERFRYLNPGMPTQMESIVRLRATELAVAARQRRRESFDAIRLAFRWLGRQPGRHSVILVTSGFPSDPTDPDFEKLATESLRVNAPVHFLDVSSPSASGAFEGIQYAHALPQSARVAPFEAVDAAAGSEQLSLATGGLRVAMSNVSEGLARILDATRSYYVIGYEPPRSREPGFRKIKVEVLGKGRKVLARRGYFDGDTSPAAEDPQSRER